jgi:multisubunit Na+/H+ antiporter MnhB subunit
LSAWALVDGLLVALLLALAWASLESRDLRRGVILFITFGLVLALVWGRLRAPDIALAEAAIGAGLAGALLLSALRGEPRRDEEPTGSLPAWSVTALAAALALMTGWVLWQTLPEADAVRLAGAVQARLDESGVTNPVTAVLLNFRAYDTLLELAVLLAALLGILALGPERPGFEQADPLLRGFGAVLVPLLMLTGAYLLWAGAHAPGGAFQAGALLAAAGVVLRLQGVDRAGLPGGAALRLTAVGGVALFLAVGLATALGGRGFLDYPVPWAASLILVIEVAATLAIAATLVLAFLGGTPPRWSGQAPPADDGSGRP